MRCQCCNKLLNDFESTRKFKTTNEYADMCNECVSHVDNEVDFIVRTDLDPSQINDEDLFDDEVCDEL